MDDHHYDYRALVLAYIETQRNLDAYPDVKAYHAQMLTVLEQSFGVTFTVPPAPQRALWMLFVATVHSYLSLRTPWSHFLEAGLIVSKLEDLGEPGKRIFQLSDQIADWDRASREAHLQLLYQLFECIYGKQDLIVTSSDLRARGVDDANKPEILD